MLLLFHIYLFSQFYPPNVPGALATLPKRRFHQAIRRGDLTTKLIAKLNLMIESQSHFAIQQIHLQENFDRKFGFYHQIDWMFLLMFPETNSGYQRIPRIFFGKLMPRLFWWLNPLYSVGEIKFAFGKNIVLLIFFGRTS